MPQERNVKTSIILPEKLWKAARKQAIDENRDFKDIVADALRDYLQRKGGAR